ncbi:hypothetical protein NDU88_005598 [Pleurodeles waltl]|uniref:Uncharacterized protein n=1 Tax=Pleurodeles waltl TaxID=8319 RepID=A0AAV7TB84_PLEWA|nr:hypothetical protein NDU88_005598 [Pleurodeles waltl]
MADTRPTASLQRARSQQQETDKDRVAEREKKSELVKRGGVGGSEKALLLHSEKRDLSLECLLEETELL